MKKIEAPKARFRPEYVDLKVQKYIITTYGRNEVVQFYYNIIKTYKRRIIIYWGNANQDGGLKKIIPAKIKKSLISAQHWQQ